MKILLLSRYSHLGASSRVRFYQYLPYLKTQGIHVTVANLVGNDYIEDLYAGRRKRFAAIISAYIRRVGYLLKSNRYDLLWVEYEILPWLPAWGEALLYHLGIPYVVDYDDAVFHRYNMHSRAMVRVLLGSKIDAVMRHAELVIVGNEYLGDCARKADAKRVECIPSVIDLNRYNLTLQHKNPVFTIGWIGSPVTAKYLNLIKPAIIQFYKEGNSALSLVGGGHVELDELPVRIIPWSEKTEVADIWDFDVGIMPLPDSPWERGKCGYKLIQYMACGKPVVASPVGANTEIVEHGVNGFLAESAEEWLEALTVLRDDPDLRKKMGTEGRRIVERKYCLQVTAPLLVSLLMSVTR